MKRAWAFMAVSAVILAGYACKPVDGGLSTMQSGGGTNPAELGCEGLQANFVDDGNKLDERLQDFQSQFAEYQQLKLALCAAPV